VVSMSACRRVERALVIASEFGDSALRSFSLFVGRHGSVGYLLLCPAPCPCCCSHRQMADFISLVTTSCANSARRLATLPLSLSCPCPGRDVVLGLQSDLHLRLSLLLLSLLQQLGVLLLFVEGRDTVSGAVIICTMAIAIAMGVGLERERSRWRERGGGCGQQEGGWRWSLALAVGSGDNWERGVALPLSLRGLRGHSHGKRKRLVAVLVRHDRSLGLLSEEDEVSGRLRWNCGGGRRALVGEKVLESREVLRVQLSVGSSLKSSVAPSLGSILHAFQVPQKAREVEVSEGDGGVGRKNRTNGSPWIEWL
jgi:hypothetical protein